jgi:hypothetical protein
MIGYNANSILSNCLFAKANEPAHQIVKPMKRTADDFLCDIPSDHKRRRQDESVSLRGATLQSTPTWTCSECNKVFILTYLFKTDKIEI